MWHNSVFLEDGVKIKLRVFKARTYNVYYNVYCYVYCYGIYPSNRFIKTTIIPNMADDMADVHVWDDSRFN